MMTQEVFFSPLLDDTRKQADMRDLRTLLRKYDVPGPRYTSYPPAPHFSPAFNAQSFAAEIDRSNADLAAGDLSLYFHFPFCDTLCYFCGCTMLVSNNRARIAEYIEYLKREIDLLAGMLSPARRVAQLHWGGGTPTHLLPEEIADIAGHIRARFRFHDDPEISVEIDPRGLTRGHLTALREYGFNRASIGVQDFDPGVQRAVNRIQPENVTRQVNDWCRELGFTGVNMDMIYGLPGQTVESFSRTLDTLIALSPDRIAAYNFAYVPWLKPHHTLIKPEQLPPPETKLSILIETIDKLTHAGYVYIGMDHFAKESDELTLAQRSKSLTRSFQGYTTKAGCDLFGMGMSAISHPEHVYAQNVKTLREYYDAIGNGSLATKAGYRMTKDDRIRSQVILQLMCDLSVRKSDIERDFGIHFDEYFGDSLIKLVPLMRDGLITQTANALEVSATGRLFLRNIAMCFDAYLSVPRQAKPMYSRTV